MMNIPIGNRNNGTVPGQFESTHYANPLEFRLNRSKKKEGRQCRTLLACDG
jgi:hypothetical protein